MDSCTHHCTSCSSPGEDSWHGDSIRSTGPSRGGLLGAAAAAGLTASDAFERWYLRERQGQVAGVGGAAGIVGGAGGEGGGLLVAQDRQYPCSDCCRCHA